MSTTIVCPECDTKFRPKQGAAPGKKIRCPHCEEVFVVPEDDEEEEVPEKRRSIRSAPPARVRSRSSADDEDEDDEDEDEDRSEKKGVPLFVWIAAAALLLIGGGVGIYLAVSGKKDDSQAKSGDNNENKEDGKGGPQGNGAPQGNQSKLTMENFNMVTAGMTEAEVTSLLGPPTMSISGPVRVCTWIDLSTTTPINIILNFEGGKLKDGHGSIGSQPVLVKQPKPNPPPDPIAGAGEGKPTKENFDKIRITMNETEAMRLLGPPTSPGKRQGLGADFHIDLWTVSSSTPPGEIKLEFMQGRVFKGEGIFDGQLYKLGAAGVFHAGKAPEPGAGNAKLTKENFSKIQSKMTEAQVIALLGQPVGPAENTSRGGVSMRMLQWKDTAVTPPNQVRAEFIGVDAENGLGLSGAEGIFGGQAAFIGSIPPSASASDGKPTKENFAKIDVATREADVKRILGEPTATQSAGGGIRLLKWVDTNSSPTVQITIGVYQGLAAFPIEAYFDGQKFEGGKTGKKPGPKPGPMDPAKAKLTQANLQQIAQSILVKKPLTRNEVETLLGPPTRNLGRQQLAPNVFSSESLGWAEGTASVVVHFINGRVVALR